jgi:hypothetical protein
MSAEADAVCDLCEAYGPPAAYHEADGQMPRPHAACQAIWLEEQDGPR